MNSKYNLTTLHILNGQNKISESLSINKEQINSYFKIKVSTPKKSKIQLIKILMDDNDMINPLNVEGSGQEIQFNIEKDSDNPTEFFSKIFIDSAIKNNFIRVEDSTTNPKHLKASLKCCDILKAMLTQKVDYTEKDLKFFTEVTYIMPSVTLYKPHPLEKIKDESTGEINNVKTYTSCLKLRTQIFNEIEIKNSKDETISGPILVDDDWGELIINKDFYNIDKKLTICIRDDWGTETYMDVSTGWNEDMFNEAIAPKFIELYKKRSAEGDVDCPEIDGEYKVERLRLFSPNLYNRLDQHEFEQAITTDNYTDISIVNPDEFWLRYDKESNEIKVYNKWARSRTKSGYPEAIIALNQIEIGKHKQNIGEIFPLVEFGYSHKSSLRSPSRMIDMCSTEETYYEFSLSKEDVDYFSIYGIIINDNLEGLICFKDINKK